MNTIDTSQILSPSTLQPWTGPSLAFLQNATRDALRHVCRNLYGPFQSTILPLQLWGLQRTGNVIDGGAFYWDNQSSGFNPEILFCDAADTTGWANSANPRMELIETNDIGGADPVTFSDGSIRNVHKFRNYRIVDKPATGSTIGYADLQFTTPTAAVATPNSPYTGSVTFRFDPKTGMVTLKGSIAVSFVGALPSYTLTIPVGYRPTSTKTIATSYGDDSSFTSGILSFANTGAITGNANLGGSSTFRIYFDGISYYKF